MHHINKDSFVAHGRQDGYWTDQGLTDFYILMRETPESNESLEATLHRGLEEEFGATAKIENYIGSIVSHWNHQGVEVEKTTIYFLCKLLNQDLSKRKGDIESKTDLEWLPPQFLITKMKEQAVRYGRTDLDESSILERL